MNRKPSARALAALMSLAALALVSLACSGSAAPQPTPTPAPLPKPDISGVGLTLDDLPGGFDQMSAGDLSDMKDNLDGYEAFAESHISGFSSGDAGETLYVYVGLLKDNKALGKFDTLLDNPQSVLQEIFAGSDLTASDFKAITDLSGIGDNSAALAMSVEIDGTPGIIILAGSRRGAVAVMLFDVFPADPGSTINRDAILKTLDRQAQDANP